MPPRYSWVPEVEESGPLLRRRLVLVSIICGIAGILLAVTHAPFWAGIVAVTVIVPVGLPYTMLRRVRRDDDA